MKTGRIMPFWMKARWHVWGVQDWRWMGPAVLRLYLERVPEVGYKDSCIFHVKQGCALDRSLRSDVCNSYFCGGLQVYMTGGDTVTPTMIIAGVGEKMRTSPILVP